MRSEEMYKQPVRGWGDGQNACKGNNSTHKTQTWSRIGKDLMCVSTVQAGDKRGAGRSAGLLCSNTHVLAFDQQPRSKKTHGAH